MDRKIRNDKNIIPAYKTLAAANNVKKDKETNIGMPSKAAVEEAKDWVEENQK